MRQYINTLPNAIIIDGLPCVGKTLAVEGLKAKLKTFGCDPIIISCDSRNLDNGAWESVLENLEHWLLQSKENKNTHYIFDGFIASYFSSVVLSGKLNPKHAIVGALRVNDLVNELGALHYILDAPTHMLRNNYRAAMSRYTEPLWDVMQASWSYNLAMFSGSIKRTILSKSDIETFTNEIFDSIYSPRLAKMR